MGKKNSRWSLRIPFQWTQSLQQLSFQNLMFVSHRLQHGVHYIHVVVGEVWRGQHGVLLVARYIWKLPMNVKEVYVEVLRGNGCMLHCSFRCWSTLEVTTKFCMSPPFNTLATSDWQLMRRWSPSHQTRWGWREHWIWRRGEGRSSLSPAPSLQLN